MPPHRARQAATHSRSKALPRGASRSRTALVRVEGVQPPSRSVAPLQGHVDFNVPPSSLRRGLASLPPRHLCSGRSWPGGRRRPGVQRVQPGPRCARPGRAWRRVRPGRPGKEGKHAGALHRGPSPGDGSEDRFRIAHDQHIPPEAYSGLRWSWRLRSLLPFPCPPPMMRIGPAGEEKNPCARS